MTFSTILLDFFGTLVGYSASRSEQGYPRTDALLRTGGWTGTYEGWLAQWEATFAEFDEHSRCDLSEFSMTEVATAFLNRVGLSFDGDVVADLVVTYLDEWSAGVIDIEGLRGTLEALAGERRLGVVSNTHDAGLVHGHLVRLGVADLFDDVVLSIEVGQRKPHPVIYQAALERLGAEPTQTLFVGDTLDADYEGPRHAGMHAMLITDTDGVVPNADRLATVLELPDALDNHCTT